MNTVYDNFKFEIASVEHPRLLEAVIDEATRRGVRIGRVSQGGGLQNLQEDELTRMVQLAHENGFELYLFTSPRNSFDPIVDPTAGDQLRGEERFSYALDDLRRCARIGIDGVLVADIGLLDVAGQMARNGELGSIKLKSAAAIAPRNAAAAALYERLGATSINTASTSTIEDLRAMRKRLSSGVSLDIYVESPDGLGGGLRYGEVPTFVRELSPVSLKFGLRDSPTLYPYGQHLEPMAEQTMREKVRRAQLALEVLERAGLVDPRMPAVP